MRGLLRFPEVCSFDNIYGVNKLKSDNVAGCIIFNGVGNQQLEGGKVGLELSGVSCQDFFPLKIRLPLGASVGEDLQRFVDRDKET